MLSKSAVYLSQVWPLKEKFYRETLSKEHYTWVYDYCLHAASEIHVYIIKVCLVFILVSLNIHILHSNRSALYTIPMIPMLNFAKNKDDTICRLDCWCVMISFYKYVRAIKLLTTNNIGIVFWAILTISSAICKHMHQYNYAYKHSMDVLNCSF